MCGIAGIALSPNRNLFNLRECLLAMCDAMAHRGPDDAGFYTSPDSRVALGNRRLAIRDPLYYAWADGVFLFASELKGMQASGLVSRKISPGALLAYLQLGSVPAPLAIYADIRALEAGQTLTIQIHDGASPKLRQYWSLPTGMDDDVTLGQAVERTHALLTDSVRRHLVSDAPLGAFLSGGLDSSTIVALMRQANNGTIRTCSVIFVEQEYSEASYAWQVAVVLLAGQLES